jgi:hypothetical protein
MKRSYQTEAAEGHILKGMPITQLEAFCYYGKPNLPEMVRRLRRDGIEIEKRKIRMDEVIERMNSLGMKPFNPLIKKHGMDALVSLTEYQRVK